MFGGHNDGLGGASAGVSEVLMLLYGGGGAGAEDPNISETISRTTILPTTTNRQRQLTNPSVLDTLDQKKIPSW